MQFTTETHSVKITLSAKVTKQATIKFLGKGGLQAVLVYDAKQALKLHVFAQKKKHNYWKFGRRKKMGVWALASRKIF